VTRPPGAVLPLGLNFITDSSSRSMRVLDSALSLRDSLLALSSFIFTIRSSRLNLEACLGKAMASKTSSTSELLKSMLERDLDSPFKIFNASMGFPSSTDVMPPKENVGDSTLLMEDTRRSFRSMFNARAALPSSHSCINALRSIPTDSYWIIRLAPSSDTSSVSFKFLSDSSRRTCSFAWSPLIPDEREFNFRNWVRHRSRRGVRGSFGVAGTGKAAGC
jgi:hypothetical protein